ncbi:MAG: FYDLN acid domain-containing protein [Alphaproteobacteria bacterium]
MTPQCGKAHRAGHRRQRTISGKSSTSAPSASVQAARPKFYDLGKDPIVCPTCETVFVIPKPEPARGGRKYAPRSAYDPNAQVASDMGTLKEAAAPDSRGG